MSGDVHPARRVLIAGVGNVLRGDDGFGPAVVALLEAAGGLPPDTRVVEVGTAGVRLVQELMDRYDVLVIVDAVDRGGEPGELFVLEPETPDPALLPPEERQLMAGDMHQLVPARVLTLAAALGVLPRHVRIIGCQPLTTEECVLVLSPRITAAVPIAARRVREVIDELCGAAHAPDGGAAIRRRDELLQVMYWLRGEGFAADAAPDDIARFLDVGDARYLLPDLQALVDAGLVERAGEERFRLSAAGTAEGGRRFAEEFAALQPQGHGACSDPDCDCHAAGPEACVHR